MPIRPLDGFTIGVTADRRRGEQVELLARRGASVLEAPALSIRSLVGPQLRQQTDGLIEHPPDLFVASTATGMGMWFEAADQWGVRTALTAALSTAFVAARGEKAVEAAHAAELTVWWQPASETSDAVVAHLLERGVAGRRVAVQLGGSGNLEPYDLLIAAGAELIPLTVYAWDPADDEQPVLGLVEAACDGRLDAVTFTSVPALETVFDVADRHDLRDAWIDAISKRVVCACVGASCVAAARREGVDDPLVPRRQRLGSLVQALAERLAMGRRVLVLGGRRMTVQGGLVIIDGEPVRLSARERALLEALLRRPGAVIPKSRLARDIWGTPASTRAVDTTMSRLRRRLGDAGAGIRTTRNRGYWIDAVVSDS